LILGPVKSIGFPSLSVIVSTLRGLGCGGG
jgi:hypothetical protein